MGAWIEIFEIEGYMVKFNNSRTPRWVRGLKLPPSKYTSSKFLVAPHDGCVDWNVVEGYMDMLKFMSHPTMGAWIEIL
mgnify:CR=1 FL=1